MSALWSETQVSGLPAEGLAKAGLRSQVSPRSGLTLIEVMLALLILGVALPPLVAAAGRCLSIAKKARHYETARELLARVELEHRIKRDKNLHDWALDPSARRARASPAGSRSDVPGRRTHRAALAAQSAVQSREPAGPRGFG